MRLSEASPKIILAIIDSMKEEIQAKNIKKTFREGFFKFLKNVVSIISFFKIRMQIYDVFRDKKNNTLFNLKSLAVYNDVF